MILADTSAIVAYFQGDQTKITETVDQAMKDRTLLLPPVVQTELLSDPKLDDQLRAAIEGLPLADLVPGYWKRAGELRAKLLKQKRKARLADSLICQVALDHDIPLVTLDADFNAFLSISPLRLVRL